MRAASLYLRTALRVRGTEHFALVHSPAQPALRVTDYLRNELQSDIGVRAMAAVYAATSAAYVASREVIVCAEALCPSAASSAANAACIRCSTCQSCSLGDSSPP